MDIKQVTRMKFRQALAHARRNPIIKGATSKPSEMPNGAKYYLSEDCQSGYGVTATGTLIGVFSTIKGRGSELLDSAEDNGARYLDCFEGFLTALYSARGWVEFDRVLNWTEGQPAVVFMKREI